MMLASESDPKRDREIAAGGGHAVHAQVIDIKLFEEIFNTRLQANMLHQANTAKKIPQHVAVRGGLHAVSYRNSLLCCCPADPGFHLDPAALSLKIYRKSTRMNSSHVAIS